MPPARPRSATKELRSRSDTRVYTLSSANCESITVCKTFFLATIGMTSDQMLKTALAKRKGKCIQSSPDKRGRHKPLHTLNDSVLDSIRDNIKPYRPSISHYSRAHAPNRLYLSPEFTIKGMLDNFNEKHPGNGVHYSTYYRIVRAMKISFVKLTKRVMHTNSISLIIMELTRKS